MTAITPPGAPEAGHGWRGPTIAEIARAAGLGTATVDRVLNRRDSVREPTRKKVLAALARLGGGRTAAARETRRRIAFLTDSGVSYNRALQEAVADYCVAHPGLDCPFIAVATAQVDSIKFAQAIERAAGEADAVVVVAREDMTINRVIRAVAQRRVPLVCLTTDLPNSGRSAYVGNDQVSAGATAAWLMGQLVGPRPGKILVVVSAPYRVQEDRELGFRRVLRSEFSHLVVDDRVNSNDENEYSCRHVLKYIGEHGAPAGIYNTAGGNMGIGRALQESGLAGKTVFIGHEINANSRLLLESGLMHFAIGHDVDREVALCIEYVSALLDKRPPPPLTPTRVRIYTKYSCY